MIPLFLCIFLLGSVANARVTFKLSEVLQETDLGEENRAPFNCLNGCKAYTDFPANNIYITEYDEQTKLYSIVVNFANMGDAVSSLLESYVLPPSKNYFIENRGEKSPKFVFYVVESIAPNIDSPVMVISYENGFDINGQNRMFTVLSSKYDAVRYTNLYNPFNFEYPKIYSTGFDSAGESECFPLFASTGRSVDVTVRSVVTVFAPISTVDFGVVGQHSAHVEWSKDGLISQSARSSTVYSSPGYIGCKSTNGQSYSSSTVEIRDTFMLQASNLDIFERFDQVSKEEALHFQVSEHNLDFFGSDTHYRHFGAYDPPKSFFVVLQWERKTAEASWAVQMDFETYDSQAPTAAPSTASGHVRFTYSEVLQESALSLIQNVDRARFKCDNGCSAYTDSGANNMYITQYNEETDTYTSIVNFSNMGGANKKIPEPYKLEASKNYYIENRGEKDPKFVFYVVENNAPNINAKVMVIDEDKDFVLNNADYRLVTILNSKYNSVQYSQFAGKHYPKNAPEIYATGFDAVDEKQCSPLYQSRQFQSGQLASITVLSPISTVDFGYIGDPSVHVRPNKGEYAVPNARSSAVYTSPGYVGCSNTNGQSYASSIEEINHSFTVQANNLYISSTFDKVTEAEFVDLTVNDAIIDFYGSSVLAKHFEFADPFQYDVAIQWNRNTSIASWAVQLDFAVVEPTSAPPSTTPNTDTTTSASTLGWSYGQRSLHSGSGIPLRFTTHSEFTNTLFLSNCGDVISDDSEIDHSQIGRVCDDL